MRDRYRKRMIHDYLLGKETFSLDIFSRHFLSIRRGRTLHTALKGPVKRPVVRIADTESDDVNLQRVVLQQPYRRPHALIGQIFMNLHPDMILEPRADAGTCGATAFQDGVHVAGFLKEVIVQTSQHALYISGEAIDKDEHLLNLSELPLNDLLLLNQRHEY